MSLLEVRARPVVTSLIQGTPLLLSKSARAHLVDWLVTKLMVLDVLRDGDQAFTSGERSAFYETDAIPSSLSIWVLRCGDGPWKSTFWSHAQRVTIVEGDTPPVLPPPNAAPNLKLFIWGMGEALIAACYHRELNLALEMQDEFSIRILPDPAFAPVWPKRPISSVEAQSFLRSLLDLPKRMGARVIEMDDPGATQESTGPAQT